MTPYCFNYSLGGWNDTNSLTIVQSRIRKPSKVIVFTEVTDAGSGPQYKGAYAIGFWTAGAIGTSNTYLGRLGPVHDNGANSVYADGHAKWEVYTEMGGSWSP